MKGSLDKVGPQRTGERGRSREVNKIKVAKEAKKNSERERRS